MIIPVIMAGGTGSRLWPLSRMHYPKQFLNLNGSQSMLQTTISRIGSLETLDPIVICNEEHRFIVAEQLKQLSLADSSIILEPIGRNTAPAIALAALKCSKKDDLLLVLAADHVILNEHEFCEVISQAEKHANAGRLVTFGIVPTAPETGYGYIRRGESVSQNGKKIFEVEAFVEKPDVLTANEYLSTGEYYWNSGMFLFRAGRYLEELQKYRSDIYNACLQAMETATTDLDFIRVDESAFRACPDDSIDYAVMEKTDDAVVIPLDAGWSDVGSWSSLWEISNKDSAGNVSKGDVITYNTENCYLHSESSLLTAVGIKDIVIVQTKDALLVAHAESVQDVKKIVEKLKKDNRQEHLIHREAYRPWGKIDSIGDGERYKVKRVTVKPGETISQQKHYNRVEHWIIVGGTAKVTLDDEVKILSENESIYIPVGVKHSLENPGKILLELIEVSSGSYLGDDDIIRFSGKDDRNMGSRGQ